MSSMQELQAAVYEKRNEIMGLLASFRENRPVMKMSGESMERSAVGEVAMRNLQDAVLRKKKTYGDQPDLFLFEVRCIETEDLVRRAAMTVALEHIKFSMADFRLDLCRILELHLMSQDLSKVPLHLMVDHVERMYSRLEKDPGSLEIDPGFSDEFLDLGDLSTEPYGGFD